MHANGIHLKFAQPVDPAAIAQHANRLVMAWNYRYGPAYGSAEYSSHHVGLKGHDILEVTGAHVTDGGAGVFLEIPDLQPANQVQVFLKTGSGKPTHLFATAHRLAPDYTAIPGYAARPKTIMPHPILTDLAVAVKSVPNRWRYPMAGARKVTIDAGPNLSFQQKVLSAKAGEVLALTFANPDVVPHNWALLKPGSLARVGAEANLLVSDPEALARHYIPAGDNVLANTDVVAPGERFTIYFQAPKAKGRYPYVCTFPGHWMVMNGNLVVE
jgi:azurin